jgi:PKD repeat protein
MKLFLKYLLVLSLTFVTIASFAQLHETGVPSADRFNLESVNPVIYLIDTVITRHESRKNDDLQPVQAGVTLPAFSEDYLSKGVWEETDEGYVWRVAINVPSAKAVNLYLKNLQLKERDKLFVYSPDLKETLGAFTYHNNREHLALGLINGENLVFEYDTPYKTDELPFEISEIGVVLVAGDRGFGDAGSCEVPVNCEEGEDWKAHKRGVARILVKRASQTFWCTGSLVNNAKNDGAPFLLTANHCGDGASGDDYNQWLFDFDYESPDCNRPIHEPEKVTFSGAFLLASGTTPRTSGSDFKLLFLAEEVPDEYHMFFNGWDRSGDIPKKGVVIHHPQGDIKYISTYTEPAISSFYYGSENPAGPFWKVTWSETENGYGVTEGGSSGSPLFNENQLIVGTLTGGDASCNSKNKPDYFGKFSESWDQNGSGDHEQLKHWLDPDDTGVEIMEGYFKGSNLIEAKFSSDITKIISGSFIEFKNYSFGNIKEYHWEFEGGEPSSSDEKQPDLVYYNKPGDYRVTLIAKSIDNADTLVREDYIHVISNIYPNPFITGMHERVHILTGNTPLENAVVYISDVVGRLVEVITPQFGDVEISFSPVGLRAGTYVVTTIINEQTTSYKLVIMNAEMQ